MLKIMKMYSFITIILLAGVCIAGADDTEQTGSHLAAIRSLEKKASEAAWKLISTNGTGWADNYKVAVHSGWLFAPVDNELEYIYASVTVATESRKFLEIVMQTGCVSYVRSTANNREEVADAMTFRSWRKKHGLINSEDLLYAYRVLFEPKSPEKKVIIIYLGPNMNELVRRLEPYDRNNVFLTADSYWHADYEDEIFHSMSPAMIDELEHFFDEKAENICVWDIVKLDWAENTIVCRLYDARGYMRLVRQNGEWSVLRKFSAYKPERCVVDARVLSSLFKSYQFQPTDFTNKIAIYNLQENISFVCEGWASTLLPKDFRFRKDFNVGTKEEDLIGKDADVITKNKYEEFIKKYRYDLVVKREGNKFEMRFNFISSRAVIWEYYVLGEYDEDNRRIIIEKIQAEKLLEKSPYFRAFID